MRAVDAVAGAAEHEIVARRAPGRLFRHLDVGQAVLGEETLLLGDDQRRRVGERDIAERRLCGLQARALRESAIGQERFCRRQRRRRAFQRVASADGQALARNVGCVIAHSGPHLSSLSPIKNAAFRERRAIAHAPEQRRCWCVPSLGRGAGRGVKARRFLVTFASRAPDLERPESMGGDRKAAAAADQTGGIVPDYCAAVRKFRICARSGSWRDRRANR